MGRRFDLPSVEGAGREGPRCVEVGFGRLVLGELTGVEGTLAETSVLVFEMILVVPESRSVLIKLDLTNHLMVVVHGEVPNGGAPAIVGISAGVVPRPLEVLHKRGPDASERAAHSNRAARP